MSVQPCFVGYDALRLVVNLLSDFHGLRLRGKDSNLCAGVTSLLRLRPVSGSRSLGHMVKTEVSLRQNVLAAMLSDLRAERSFPLDKDGPIA